MDIAKWGVYLFFFYVSIALSYGQSKNSQHAVTHKSTSTKNIGSAKKSVSKYQKTKKKNNFSLDKVIADIPKTLKAVDKMISIVGAELNTITNTSSYNNSKYHNTQQNKWNRNRTIASITSKSTTKSNKVNVITCTFCNGKKGEYKYFYDTVLNPQTNALEYQYIYDYKTCEYCLGTGFLRY